jgi:ABC-type polysaccharide/polyol phosphate export permease
MEALATQPRQPGYFQRIWQLRHFWLSLVRLDLRARYRRSVLGIGWSLVRPLAMCAVLCVVFAKLFHIDDVGGYAPFLLLGLAVWQFLTEAAILGCTSFTGASVYIRQQPLPLAIFPLRTVLGAGFHALIALGVGVAASLILRGQANLAPLPSLFIAVPLLFLAGWSMAILTGLAHAHFPDTQHLLEIAFQILFYLSPIMYPAEALQGHRGVTWVINLNPVTYFLEIIRRPLLSGANPPLEVYLVAAAWAGSLALVAVCLMRRLENRLVFWL